ncbi:MAG: thiamine phosphate synthase, partial [Planctomycetaceae bacterium]|nr:thiamine phosphate synthase [Planctomycetaceae bacterium]
TVGEARRIVGPSKLIGVSTHSLTQAREAVSEGADYIGVGPVFPSTTKHFEKHVGLTLVREVSAEIKLPMFAIGGITLGNLSKVIEAGACGVAVSGAMNGLGELERVVREFKRCLAD